MLITKEDNLKSLESPMISKNHLYYIVIFKIKRPIKTQVFYFFKKKIAFYC